SSASRPACSSTNTKTSRSWTTSSIRTSRRLSRSDALIQGIAMAQPYIKLVVAYSSNRVIGRDNDLPWRLPSDLAHFKRMTMGQPILMGRKTWESLGRPLPGRPNLVISRNAGYVAEGASVFTSLADALAACQDEASVCVIGGAQIFADALPLADEVIATEIHAHVDGDVFFPTLPAGQWHETERLPQPEENGYRYDFVTYCRNRE